MGDLAPGHAIFPVVIDDQMEFDGGSHHHEIIEDGIERRRWKGKASKGPLCVGRAGICHNICVGLFVELRTVMHHVIPGRIQMTELDERPFKEWRMFIASGVPYAPTELNRLINANAREHGFSHGVRNPRLLPQHGLKIRLDDGEHVENVPEPTVIS